MKSPPTPPNERERLESLESLRILDTESEEGFDEIARVASQMCGMPVGLVSFVDAHRQWFKARVGWSATESTRDISFCGHAVVGGEVLVVPDTLEDARFADNPLVTGGEQVRFYCGVPLAVDEGSAVGTLCVIDHVPRTLTPQQLHGLRVLARQIERELRYRRALAKQVQMVAAHELPEGAILGGGWTIVKELGRGGVGVVYEVRGTDGSRAAAKVLLGLWSSSDDVVERFVREARVLSRLKSDHVARLTDVGNLSSQRGSLPFLVMEYLDGRSFAQIAAERGAIPWREVVAWVMQACEGVAEAHAAGVIHRDIKPANLFLTNQDVVKVLDFGIAKADMAGDIVPALTMPDAIIGSPSYMSPEQLLTPRDVDARTDVWSLGVVIYTLLSGSCPFRGRSMTELFAAVLMTPAPEICTPGVPRGLADVVARCLSKERGERPESMRELIGLLSHVD